MAQFKHERIERNVFLMIVFTLLTVSVGGLVEIVPLFFQHSTTSPIGPGGKQLDVKPYDAVRLVGRDIYIREGCSNCHSQMIRPFRAETERYGHYSVAGESVYDHPFLWGSKRTGPDLARVGGRYSDEWHIDHLVNPQAVVPESIMPSYGFLLNRQIDPSNMGERLSTDALVGVPYDEVRITAAIEDFRAQADPDADASGLEERYPGAQQRNFDRRPGVSEMDALIAYLQVLGTMVDFSTFQPDPNR